MKRHKQDYCKEVKYIGNLCAALHPMIRTAIAHAKALEHNREDRSDHYPRAEVYKLIETVFCKPQR